MHDDKNKKTNKQKNKISHQETSFGILVCTGKPSSVNTHLSLSEKHVYKTIWLLSYGSIECFSEKHILNVKLDPRLHFLLLQHKILLPRGVNHQQELGWIKHKVKWQLPRGPRPLKGPRHKQNIWLDIVLH